MALAWSRTLGLMLLLAAGRGVGASEEAAASARPLLNKRHMGLEACASAECVSEYSLLQTARDQEATDLGWPKRGGGDLIPIECHRESTPGCKNSFNGRRRRVRSCPWNAHNLPKCNQISPGQMCKAYGEYGTNTELNNCYTHGAAYDIYIWVTPPTRSPTPSPTRYPTGYPTVYPTAYPTPHPSSSPTEHPTSSPTASPTPGPTASPTPSPSWDALDTAGLQGKSVEPSQPGAPLQPGAPSQPGDVGATGDPHLQNIHNERFDIMRPGKHVLLQIPKEAEATRTLLRVGADVAHVGGTCSDMYIQMLNVTGQWAGDGVQYRASAGHASPRWTRFGEIELKVVWGRTRDGDKHYLNMFAKHLGKIGYSVGGLLGEDDHTQAATPIHGCDQSLSLMSGPGRTPGIGAGSSAEASLL